MKEGTAIMLCHGQFEHELVKDLKERCINNVLIVCGKSSFSASSAAERLNDLNQIFNVAMFNDFSENPTIAEANHAYEIYLNSDAEAIIAIGGGSAIDIAKLVVALNVTDVSIESLVENGFSQVHVPPYLIAVPTTSGSGSESTHFAVVYKGDAKYSIAHDSLLPKLALLDGTLTLSMSRKQAACSGLDAMCQAIESIWAKSATIKSTGYAVAALKIIKQNLVRSVNASDYSSRLKCIEAANLAGQAINITKTTAPHAYSYYLTKKYGTPHGIAVALSMIAVLQASIETEIDNDSTFSRRLRVITEELCLENASELIGYIQSLLLLFDLPISIKVLGCNSLHLVDEYLSSVNTERLNNHPMKIKSSILRRIILEG